jgi:hypothetical protein
MTPEEIAASLTKAQREALCPNEIGWADCHKGKAWSRTLLTACKLYEVGLIEAPKHLAIPTPLGLKVRNILKGQTDGKHS